MDWRERIQKPMDKEGYNLWADLRTCPVGVAAARVGDHMYRALNNMGGVRGFSFQFISAYRMGDLHGASDVLDRIDDAALELKREKHG
jgi:hypothetical protein